MTPAPDPKKPRYLALSVTVAAIMSALFAGDKILALAEKTEIAHEARAQYDTGMGLLQRGKSKDALPALQRAHALERADRAYTLGLSDALLSSGSYDDAEVQLRDILRGDSNDGKANLLLAHLLAARSRTAEAIAFYHRAIYGTWPASGTSEPLKVRRELAEYLAGVHRPQELLSELLLLEDSAEKQPALIREMAGLFLTAGSSGRAAQLYHQLLRTTPGDWDAYRGLGESDLLEGDYRGAESMFLLALKHNPSDADLPHRFHFANVLATLDPTPRRLSSAEKFTRATTLLATIRAEVPACTATHAPPSSPLLIAAQNAAATEPKGPITNEVAEARLSLAEQLWKLRSEVCRGPEGGDAATSLIMQKVTRTQ